MNRGYWIEVDMDDFICSKCGEIQEWTSKYCPECGAYMVGDDGRIETKDGVDVIVSFLKLKVKNNEESI